jgi:hypothetical protein
MCFLKSKHVIPAAVSTLFPGFLPLEEL